MNHAGESSLDGFPVDAWAALYSPPRRLAIVGSHPNGREGVPWDDPACEIWLFNEAPLKVEKYPRWDVLIQLHGPEVYASERNWVNPDYWPWLQEHHGKPIYMQAVDPRVPDSVRYPIEAILALTPYRYLRSSPAMALALAIHQGYQTIELYGSELTSNTEYAYQATNYAFWIGFAHGRGVDLRLNCWQSEFWQRLYGYEGELQIDRAYYAGRAADHEAAYNNNKRSMDKLRSQIDAAMLKGDVQKVASLSLQLDSGAVVTGETFGALQEAKRYAEREDLISRQEFERVSAQAQKDGDEMRSRKDHAGGKTEYVWNVWNQTGSNIALNQLREFIKEKSNLAMETGRLLGVYRENLHYLHEYDTRLQAAGGVRALGR